MKEYSFDMNELTYGIAKGQLVLVQGNEKMY